MIRRSLIFALLFLALGGFMLHLRIHHFMIADKMSPGALHFSGTYFLSNLMPFIDVFLVTTLFLFRKTAAYGYLLNGLIVIFGTILMTHFSIASFMVKHVPPSQWIMNSLLPDIGVAWADFFVGKALYDYYLGRT
ncbi:MAG TPA: hypothetical protein VMT62_04595 [Syntrophorhabdaceae bacterium]|nr:hypothetical protein [Syntrophorhabdaceae bacterium]